MKKLFLVFAVIAAVLVASSAIVVGSPIGNNVSLDQRVGSTLPGDLVFKDETGASLKLSDLIDKPTLIAPVYLSCPHTCPLILGALSNALGGVSRLTPGRDFQVVAVSFNEGDTPELALEKKKNYITAIGKPFPDNAWKFLVGDRQNIEKFLSAAGIEVQKTGMDFSHPATLLVVSKTGQIIRYLSGVNYGSFDLEMALTEAAKGEVGIPTSRILGYCFSFDPAKRAYVFNVLRGTGAAMVLFLVGFIAFLAITSRKKSVNPLGGV